MLLGISPELLYFPLLVLKGIYHNWTYFIFPGDLKQMEDNPNWIPLGDPFSLLFQVVKEQPWRA